MAGTREAQIDKEHEYRKKLADADDRHGNRDLTLVGPYLGQQFKTLHRCNKCGHKWSVKPNNLLARLQNCPGCKIQKRQPHEKFLSRLKAVHGNTIEFSFPHEKHRIVNAKCSTCGNKWCVAYHNAVKGSGCPKCSGSWKRTSADFVLEGIEAHGQKFSYSKVDYLDRHSPIVITCSEHGDFLVKPYVHLSSRTGGCPKCVRPVTVSGAHQKILSLLDKNSVPYEVNNRKVLGGKELDVWIPLLKVAIEINGLYWHSDTKVSRMYHYEKALACRRLGIQLIQFWDYEIYSKWPIVSSLIQAKLGRAKRLYARKLKVVILDPMRARKWFIENHLQGAVNSTVNYGLVSSEGEIYCGMSFSKPRFSKHEWELTRLAFARGCTVVGGPSRLLAAFNRQHTPVSLVSYADLRHSQGKVYKKLGMKFAHVSKPNYFYYLDGKAGVRWSRYEAQKHKLARKLACFNPNLTEDQNMKLNGFRRVFDAGNLVFTQVLGVDMIDQHSFA